MGTTKSETLLAPDETSQQEATTIVAYERDERQRKTAKLRQLRLNNAATDEAPAAKGDRAETKPTIDMKWAARAKRLER